MEITGEQLLPTDYRDYSRANPFERFVARFFDRLIAILSGVAIGYIVSQLNSTAGIALGITIALGYICFKDALPFLNGQSIGKKMLGIKVADANTGTDIKGKYLTAFLREVPTFIPLVSLIDALIIFGDSFANTVVVNMPRNYDSNSGV